jgi:2-methylcitrate dehydratase PrpD
MAHETRRLAEYAAALRYEDIPANVLERAKQCIADTVAAVVFGNNLPWGKMIVAYARSAGPGGKGRILGAGGDGVQASTAALANGTLAHSFELDSLYRPSVGVHPGACILPAALAAAQDRGGVSGRDLIAAFVAASEVVYRIGSATGRSNEHRGFHAPGTTGVFGAAIAVSRMLKLDSEKTTNALGIAGSLASGLVEFARAGSGGMVKRLHLGRAAESGVLAGSLASLGYTGPATVLEGEFGFLRVFCDEYDVTALADGLGERFDTLNIGLKPFACHFNPQPPIDALVTIREASDFSARDVAAIEVVGPPIIVERHNIPTPADMMLAQYSVPFCVALALFRDMRDPAVFDQSVLSNEEILAVSRSVVLKGDEAYHHGTSAITITLKDGRKLTHKTENVRGMPARPMTKNDLRGKFLHLAGPYSHGAERLYERRYNLEDEANLDWIDAAPVAAREH